MVTVAVLLPPGPAAVSVKVVVLAGLTLVLALPHETAPTPLLIEQVVALAIPVHASVDDCPAVIVVGLAVNEAIVGAVAPTVTLTPAVLLPPGPVAVSV
jgi:hypothetical protein